MIIASTNWESRYVDWYCHRLMSVFCEVLQGTACHTWIRSETKIPGVGWVSSMQWCGNMLHLCCVLTMRCSCRAVSSLKPQNVLLYPRKREHRKTSRPITLLNTDYKISARLIGNRLRRAYLTSDIRETLLNSGSSHIGRSCGSARRYTVCWTGRKAIPWTYL